MMRGRVELSAKVKVIRKPVKWDEKSLVLATKDELVADLLMRQALINQLKKSKNILYKLRLQNQMNWVVILQNELRSRYVLEME
jgi:hypothetical protein